jgi:hypothetical protein
LGIFAWAAFRAQRQAIPIDMGWLAALSGATLLLLVVGGAWLWRRTRFS